MRITINCEFDPFIKGDNWLVCHVRLGPITAVEMMCSCQRHSHRSEGGLDLQDRLEELAEELEHQSNEVHKHEGDVVLRSIVTQSRQNPRQEGPEEDRLIICYMVRLKKQIKILLYMNYSHA